VVVISLASSVAAKAELPDCVYPPPCETAGSVLPYPEDCTKFIKCNEDLSFTVEQCPLDFEFSTSPEFMQCVPVYFAECHECKPTMPPTLQ